MQQDPDMDDKARGTLLDADAVVTLNVGGVRYTSTLSTLTSVPNTYLSALFSGRWGRLLERDGEVFIDRDGQVFKYVLQYLRAVNYHDASFDLPTDSVERNALKVEAHFYNLVTLAEMLETNAPAQVVLGCGPTAGGVLLPGLVCSRRLWQQYQHKWEADNQLQDMRKLVMEHILQNPLAANQVDLVAHLAQGRGGLALSLSHHPLGPLRFQVDAVLLGVKDLGADCDEGTVFATTKVMEEASSYTMKACFLGAEGMQEVTVPRQSNKDFCQRYAALHKLLVQTTPRESYRGLLWLLEQEGFSQVVVRVDRHAAMYQYTSATITLEL